jgi:hypothetical protein
VLRLGDAVAQVVALVCPGRLHGALLQPAQLATIFPALLQTSLALEGVLTGEVVTMAGLAVAGLVGRFFAGATVGRRRDRTGLAF